MSDNQQSRTSNSSPKLANFPRGSEWRKWDLHVHAPGTKLSDGYGTPSDLDRFSRIIEESDVRVFGITDYFSADAFFAVAEKHAELFPESTKVLLPNIELRLNETVNGSNQVVDLHLVLQPDVAKDKVDELLRELKTEITEGSGRQLRCSELTTKSHFESATVTRGAVEDAIQQTFGKSVPRDENVIVIVPSNNNGIRSDPGQQRKANLADQIDKLSDAIFGNSGNVDYFLRSDRAEDSAQTTKPKPVFAGSDAHSFDQLEQWLGKSVTGQDATKEVTWIKADPTFEGLQQTLVEPADRVRIQTAAPDAKEPYKVISAVHFEGGGFPKKIELNPNLVSIIGSRSSGKSALIAYIAHAIDPAYTIRQQVASGIMEEGKAGPAAGKTWREVTDIKVTVEWADPAVKDGKIIYIPQNSLFAISEQPDEITAKIQPALYRMDLDIQTAHQRMTADIAKSKSLIDGAVREWFRLGGAIDDAKNGLRDQGDPKAVQSTRDGLAAKVAELRASSSLTPEDVAAYQSLVEQLGAITTRGAAIRRDTAAIAPYVSSENGKLSATAVAVDVRITPAPSSLPRELGDRLSQIAQESSASLSTAVRDEVVKYREALDVEETALVANETKLRADNAALIARNQANAELEELVKNHQKQDDLLKQINVREAELAELVKAQQAQVVIVEAEMAALTVHVTTFATEFDSKERTLDSMVFGVEHQITDDDLRAVSIGFNRQENTTYFDRSSDMVKIDQVFKDPAAFLRSLKDGTQKVRRESVPADLAVQALTTTHEVRFVATLEGDRIGGFSRSSMTPGKQALFALSLILNESTEAWPLLIDQPEDDLDSRSIFDTIVPYLVARKRDRQILMVSHDANLVVGADSEQVVVANRHGDDRRNRGDQTFDYLSGSLEQSMPRVESEFVLESCGIREHACEILDGGEAAFQKRRDKYKI